MKTEKGFTLLEIMVALAVFATLAGALLSASQFVLQQSARVENRLFAAWLADNQLSELQLGLAPLTLGQRSQTSRFAQRDWRLNQRIVREPKTSLYRVELSVSLADSEQPVHSLTHWIKARHD